MNCAERLFLILRSAEMHDGKAFADAWQDVFGLQRGDKVGLLKKMAELHDLIAETEKTFRQLEGHKHDLYLSGLPKLRAALFPQHWDRPWNVKSALTPETMALLQICGDRLDAISPEPEISNNILGDITNAILDLLKEIHGAELDKKLKSVLLDLLSAMLKTLSSYSVGGVKRMRRDLFGVLSLMEEQHELLLKEIENPLVKKVTAIIQTIDQVTATAQKIRPLLEYGQKWAPMLVDIVTKVS